MAHPETPEAGDVGNPADNDPADAFNAIAEEMLGGDQEEEPAEGDEALEPHAEEAEDDTDIEAEEIDELPPIEAPVSWDAEAKAKFAELPRELQETVTKREAERERFVQQKSQEAARAKQEVEQTAYQQLAQYERQVAEQIQSLASQIGPQRPDPAMLSYDPAGFYAQQAQYEQSVAQQRELQQQAQQYAEQAKQREAMAEQVFHAEQTQKLVESFPEYLDPTNGPKLQAELSSVARELGYSPELISQARADDILAMKTAAEWKAKATRYDALMSKKMEKVRSAKGLPKVATPGVSQGTDQLRANRAKAAFERVQSSRNVQDKGDAFYEYLKNSGHI